MTNVKSILSVASVLAVLMSAPVAKASDSVKKTYAEAAAEVQKLKKEKDAFSVKAMGSTKEERMKHEVDLLKLQDAYDKKYVEAMEIELSELEQKDNDLAKTLFEKWTEHDKKGMSKPFEGTKEAKELIDQGSVLKATMATKQAAIASERKMRLDAQAARLKATIEQFKNEKS